MDQDTILLLSQLENLPELSKLRSRLKKRTWTPKIHTMLDMCFQHIHASDVAWEDSESAVLDSLVKLDENQFQEKITDNFHIIPERLKQSIRDKCVNRFSVRFSFSNRIFTVYIALTRTHTTDHLCSIIYYSFLWLYFVNIYVTESCSNEVNIFLFFLKDKKLLPDNNIIFDREHVNTAFTTTCQKKTDVYIFREEEWFRALIHESFHNLGLDLHSLDPKILKQCEEKIKNTFPSVRMVQLHLPETYCEMWAEMLNVMFYVYTDHYPTHGKKLPLVAWKKKWMSWMVYEKLFSAWQCVKVLDHNNIHYENLLVDAKHYRENTPTFSYYVLKCILITNLNDFLSFCADQYFITSSTPHGSYGIKFYPTQENLEKYCQLFVDSKHHSSIEMRHATTFMKSLLPKKKRTTLYKTLRMSLLQHEL